MSATLADSRAAVDAARGALETEPVAGVHGSVTPSWSRRHYLLVAGVGLLIGLRRAEFPLPDTDVLWSSRFGLDLLATGHLDRVDLFSWTAAGKPWIANSWAWNVALGGAYGAAGVLGVWLIAVGLSIAFALMLGRASAAGGARPVPTAMVIAGIGFVVLLAAPRATAVSNLMLLALPPLLPALLFGSRRTVARNGAMIIGLEIAWMNLHASAILAPLVVLVAAASLVVGRELRGIDLRRAVIRLVATVALMGFGLLITPYGLALPLHASAVRTASVGLINEWQPAGFGDAGAIFGVVAIVVALPLAWYAWRGRRYDTAGILLLLAAATGTAVRFVPMVAVMAMPELAIMLSALNVRAHMFRRILAAGCAVIALVTVLGLNKLGQLTDAQASPTLVRMIPTGCRLVNDYGVGGEVMLARSDVRVSLDGRNDMYGRELVIAAAKWLDGGPAARHVLDAAGVDCVLANSSYPLVRQLDDDPGWKILGRDSARTLLVRKGSPS